MVQGWFLTGDGIQASRWLDELPALNQPPKDDDGDVVSGQVFRTNQSYPFY